VLAKPVRTARDVARLRVPDPVGEMPFVMDAVRLIRAGLAGRVPLIGFCGAPWTSRTWSRAAQNTSRSKLMFGNPRSTAR
jgi:uroporphyrinogen decarboxylase